MSDAATSARPCVTWLMPVLNGMPYVREALASLAAQTYPHHRILAWDNGSTDGTLQELRRWIPHRIPGRIVHDQPLALGRCRAAMVEAAETELLAPMDADDVSLPDRLERQVAFMCEHRDIALLGGAQQMTDEQLGPIGDAAAVLVDEASVRWNLRFSCTISQGACMFRRSAVLEAGNYYDVCPGQDFNLFARLSRRHRMANVPDVVLLYRQHGQSVSHQNPADRAELDRLGRSRVADILYPGMSQARYERLYRVVRSYNSLEVSAGDIVALRRLAVRSARVCGERPDYFLKCPAYRRQFSNLLTRWVKSRPGLAPIWPAVRAAGRSLGGAAAASTSQPTPAGGGAV